MEFVCAFSLTVTAAWWKLPTRVEQLTSLNFEHALLEDFQRCTDVDALKVLHHHIEDVGLLSRETTKTVSVCIRTLRRFHLVRSPSCVRPMRQSDQSAPLQTYVRVLAPPHAK